MKKIHVLVFTSFLIAIEIILTRYIAIQTPIVRIGFGFLPIAFIGMMFGPVLGGLAAMVCDILGMMIFPKGAYFPGFTFSALIGGMTYGLFLYNKPKSIIRIFIAVLLITVFVDLGMNTIWLWMITKKAIAVMLPTRVVSNLIMLPIKVFVIHTAWRYLGSYISRTAHS